MDANKKRQLIDIVVKAAIAVLGTIFGVSIS